MFDSAAEALKYLETNDIAMVDLKVVGVAGQWLHLTIPARQFTQKHFEQGVGYDGSSGSGFGKVESGDVAARPDPTTAFLDPFCEHPTLSFLCDTVTADTKVLFPSDPRNIARRAVERMRAAGIADEAWMGPEFEFHVFDRVEVTNKPYYTNVEIHSAEMHTDGLTPAIPHKHSCRRPTLRFGQPDAKSSCVPGKLQPGSLGLWQCAHPSYHLHPSAPLGQQRTRPGTTSSPFAIRNSPF